MKEILKTKNMEIKMQRVLEYTAKTFGKIAVNSACFYLLHQPKMPEKLKELRKF